MCILAPLLCGAFSHTHLYLTPDIRFRAVYIISSSVKHGRCCCFFFSSKFLFRITISLRKCSVFSLFVVSCSCEIGCRKSASNDSANKFDHLPKVTIRRTCVQYWTLGAVCMSSAQRARPSERKKLIRDRKLWTPFNLVRAIKSWLLNFCCSFFFDHHIQGYIIIASFETQRAHFQNRGTKKVSNHWHSFVGVYRAHCARSIQMITQKYTFKWMLTHTHTHNHSVAIRIGRFHIGICPMHTRSRTARY